MTTATAETSRWIDRPRLDGPPFCSDYAHPAITHKYEYDDPLFLCFNLNSYHTMILYARNYIKIKSQTQLHSYLLKKLEREVAIKACATLQKISKYFFGAGDIKNIISLMLLLNNMILKYLIKKTFKKKIFSKKILIFFKIVGFFSKNLVFTKFKFFSKNFLFNFSKKP